MNCVICNTTATLPYTLICGHTFCFLCIKTNYMDGVMECPTCNKFIVDNLNNVKIGKLQLESLLPDNYQWVYSSAFSNKWWCYDNKSNRQIEMIYLDYNKRINSSGSNTEIQVKLNLGKATEIATSPKIDIVFTQYKSVKDDTSFEYMFFEDEGVDEDTEQTVPISYILRIGTLNYRIDFEEMKQINMDDIRKQRKIMRLELPSKLEESTEFLKQHDVVGVAGMKFV